MLRIRAERLRRGWSQTVLAFRAGLSSADVSKIETGVLRPYPKQAAALAAALGIADPKTLTDEVITDTTATPSRTTGPGRSSR